jgi:hypothetical protein
MASRQHCDKEKQNQMMQFHGDKKDFFSAVQNYHICQAIERPVQTFWGFKNCNALWMNLLQFCLFQTFSGEKSKILGVFGLKVLALTNSILPEVLPTTNIF